LESYNNKDPLRPYQLIIVFRREKGRRERKRYLLHTMREKRNERTQ
jgi:hypothetical protein